MLHYHLPKPFICARDIADHAGFSFIANDTASLSDEQLELMLPARAPAVVRALLHLHAPHHTAFGSRVVSSAQDRARVKPHSDLDLALSATPLPLKQMFTLREAFSESDLPMRVDIVDMGDLPAGWNIRVWPL